MIVALESEIESSAKHPPVILSVAKDLVFTVSYEILRSLCSLRMTIFGTFAEVSPWHQYAQPPNVAEECLAAPLAGCCPARPQS